jgi:predicted DNA-binding ribbon-helix-helix protein
MPSSPGSSEPPIAALRQTRYPQHPASPGRHRLTGLIKRSFSLAGHRTSVALEEEFWTTLNRMAQTRGQTLSTLVATVDATRDPDRPLASALRVFALAGNEIPPPA